MQEENTKNLAVIDASFILAALLPDEVHAQADEIIQKYLNKTLILLTSPLFPLEVVNAIRMAVVRKRIAGTDAQKIIRRFLKLGIPTEPIDVLKTFLLSQKYNLSIYDASYLFLAKQHKTSLLTTDKKLQELA